MAATCPKCLDGGRLETVRIPVVLHVAPSARAVQIEEVLSQFCHTCGWTSLGEAETAFLPGRKTADRFVSV